VTLVVASKLSRSCLILIAMIGVGCGGQGSGKATGAGGAGAAGGAGGSLAEHDGGNSSDGNAKDAPLDTGSSDARGGANGAAGGNAGSGGKAGTGGADGGSGVGGNGGASAGRCSSFQLQPSHPSGDQLLVDMNGDGRRDIVTTWSDTDTHVLIYRQTAPRVFAAPAENVIPSIPCNGLATYDLDQDGILDIAASNRQALVGLLLSGGGSGYKAAPLLRPPIDEDALDVVLADFDGDGFGDIVVPIQNGGTTLGMYWGTGGGAFAARADLSYCTSGSHAAVIDANEDGRPDLAISCEDSGSVVLINQGNRKFTSVLLAGTSRALALATGDLNHDGHVDVVIPDLVFNQLLVYLGDGHGAFTVPTGLFAATATQPFTAAIGDLDGDGKADLVLGDFIVQTIAFYRGTGDGHFQAAQQLPMTIQSNTLTIDDVDGDGFQDLMTGDGPRIFYGPCP